MAAKKSNRKANSSTNMATISDTSAQKMPNNSKKKKKNRAMTISHHLSKTLTTSTNSDNAHRTTTTTTTTTMTNRMELFDCFVECLATSATCTTKRLSEEVNECELDQNSSAAKLLADEERRFGQRFDQLNRQLDKLRSLQSNLNEFELSSLLKSKKTNACHSEEDHYEQFLDNVSDLNKKFDVEMAYLNIWHENQKLFVQEQYEHECKYLSDELENKKIELKEKLLSETLERRRQLKTDIDLMELIQVNPAMATWSIAHAPNLNQPTLIRRKLRRRTNQKPSQSQLAQQSASS